MSQGIMGNSDVGRAFFILLSGKSFLKKPYEYCDSSIANRRNSKFKVPGKLI